jgi:hypothetical protein
MNTHLSSQEFVDALEGGLEAVRQRHLGACAACQTQVETLRAIMADVGSAGDEPEPSPLFWDHFQSRVQAAVREESSALARSSWWEAVIGAGTMRTWLTACAAVAVVVMVSASYLRGPVVKRGAESPDGAVATTSVLDTTTVPAEPELVPNTVEWNFVSGILATLEEDDVRRVLTPSDIGVDAAFQSLSEQERKTFLRLLQAEMVAGLE